MSLDPRSSHVFDVYDADESLSAVGRVRVVQGGLGLATIRLQQVSRAPRPAPAACCWPRLQPGIMPPLALPACLLHLHCEQLAWRS